MKISFGPKLTEAFIEEYIPLLKESFTTNEPTIFDLGRTEWVSTEGIAFIYGWFYKLYRSGKRFVIQMPTTSTPRGNDLFEYLWKYWNICSFLDVDDAGLNYKNVDIFFQLDAGQIVLVNRLARMRQATIGSLIQQGGVFDLLIPLQVIKIPSRSRQEGFEKAINAKIDQVFSIEKNISNLLNKYTIGSAIENKIMSHIIAWELLQNSLEHGYVANDNNKFCVCVLGMTRKPENGIYPAWMSRNYKIEKSIELHPFFIDERSDKMKDRSYLEFTFLDMGIGIAHTLRDSYDKNWQREKSELGKEHEMQDLDTRILEYAFINTSSRQPLSDKIQNYDCIPRGLYYLIDYVRRYKGLIVIRSNKGKISYDLSKEVDGISECICYPTKRAMSDLEGTMVTIYIPALENKPENSRKTLQTVRLSPPRPHRRMDISHLLKPGNPSDHYISLLHLYNEALRSINENTDYIPQNQLIKNFVIELLDNKLREIARTEKNGVLFVDFSFFPSKNIGKKILYYLTSSVYISLYLRCVIANLSDFDLIEQFNTEIRGKLPFIYRPIPCCRFDYSPLFGFPQVRFCLKWIGVKYAEDERLLSDLLLLDPYPNHLQSSFIDSSAAMEHFLIFDKFGNIQKLLLNGIETDGKEGKDCFSDLNNRFREQLSEHIHYNLSNLWMEDGDIDTENGEKKQRHLFLTSRGHFQHKFISLYEPLHDNNTALFIAKLLLDNYLSAILVEEKSPKLFNTIVSVTVSSQLIGSAIRNLINDPASPYNVIQRKNNNNDIRLIRLSNYYSFYSEAPFEEIKQGDKRILLVNDVISTGSLVRDFIEKIKEGGCSINAIFSIADTRVYKEDFHDQKIVNHTWEEEEGSIEFEKGNKDIVFITLCDKIKIFKPKYTRMPDMDLWGNRVDYDLEAKHINPILNSIVQLREEHSETRYLLFDTSEDFLRLIGNDYLDIGHIKFSITHNAYNVDFKGFFNQLKYRDERSERTKRFLRQLYSQLVAKENEILVKDWRARVSSAYNNIVTSLRQTAFDTTEHSLREKISKLITMMEDKEVEFLHASHDANSLFPKIDNMLNYLKGLLSGKEEFQEIFEMIGEMQEELGLEHAGFSPEVVFYPVFSAVEELMKYKEMFSEIFNCDPDNIFPLQRYDTNVGWRFCFPPKLYNLLVRHKRILILDSGSITGASLMQMIDAISIYEPYRIVVLSILGRIEDFDREFFSRIREIKVKHLLTKRQLNILKNNKWAGQEARTKRQIKELLPEDIVPIHIYFGTNIHQFAYQSKEFCPFCQELNMLSNIPKGKDIGYYHHYIKQRRTDIQSKSNYEESLDTWPSYLPMERIKKRPPFLEIFIKRDLIGKLVGYRFYPEYYSEFNSVFGMHYSQSKRDYELLMAVFLHEPRLLKPFRELMPTIYRQLELFLNAVVDEEIGMVELTFEWTKASVVSLVLKMKELEDRLFDTETLFQRLICYSFTEDYAIQTIFFTMEGGLVKGKIPIIMNVLRFFDSADAKAIKKLGITEFDENWKKLEKKVRDLISRLKFGLPGNKTWALLNLNKFYYLDHRALEHTEFNDAFSRAANSRNEKLDAGAMNHVGSVIKHIKEYFISSLNALDVDAYYSKKETYTCLFGETDSVLHEFKAIEKEYERWRNFNLKEGKEEWACRKDLWTRIERFSKRCNLRGEHYLPNGPLDSGFIDFFNNLRARPIETFIEEIKLSIGNARERSAIEWNLPIIEALQKEDVFLYIHKTALQDVFRIIVLNKMKHLKEEMDPEITYMFKIDKDRAIFTITQNKLYKGDPFDTAQKINEILSHYQSEIFIRNDGDHCDFSFFFFNKLNDKENENN